MFYSPSTNGFYNLGIHGENIPIDAVEISAEQHETLLKGQSQGKVISADGNGRPVLQDKAPPTPEQIEAQIDAARRAAYITEADPLFFKAQRGEVEQQVWLDKIAEIKARFPK
jgi:hypothetical protein